MKPSKKLESENQKATIRTQAGVLQEDAIAPMSKKPPKSRNQSDYPQIVRWSNIRTEFRMRRQANPLFSPYINTRKGEVKNVVLGIGGGMGHDGNVALIVDGKLIAASQEERFTGYKHDGCFPFSAIKDCLEIAELKPWDVDVCVFAEKPVQRFLAQQIQRPSSWLSRLVGYLMPKSWQSQYTVAAQRMLPNAKFFYAWHHLCHTAAAFYTSPFESATFLCVDGSGEDVSASLGRISHNTLEVYYEQPYENGLGMLYTLLTTYLGFDLGSEYKVMGLAPYGKPLYVDHLRSLLTEGAHGGIRFTDKLTSHESLKTAQKLVANATGIPPRVAGEPLSSEQVDIAASLQVVFEEEVIKMAKFARESVDEENLLFCGGCAQNCVVAGKLRDSSLFQNVFNSPVGGDMANGLGAALLYERQRLGKGQKVQIETHGFYLGSEPGSIPDEAQSYRLEFEGSLHEFAARLLSEGKILGWVRGRMELGARALGARSILADPRQPDMQSVLNLKIKFRESFRPFAPAVLAEEASKWFDVYQPSDYMQYTAYLKPEHRYPQPETFASMRDRLNYVKSVVPSIVHVDYSARLQTVDAKVHPDFHKLISAFFKITGIPLIINTSFNVSGQPIVRTAQEAWKCFIHTDLDFLVINDSIFRNPFNKSQEEKIQWRKQFDNHSR
ncbi:carbamoyltransferase family protein [Moorena bouillonii]|nr:carbamoyltransferase C-terminal domain-containing protein [Moorena bouillonii]